MSPPIRERFSQSNDERSGEPKRESFVSRAHANTTTAIALRRLTRPHGTRRPSRPTRARFREPLLYPLSYGAARSVAGCLAWLSLPRGRHARPWFNCGSIAPGDHHSIVAYVGRALVLSSDDTCEVEHDQDVDDQATGFQRARLADQFVQFERD
jgi:hypothetical protein